MADVAILPRRRFRICRGRVIQPREAPRFLSVAARRQSSLELPHVPIRVQNLSHIGIAVPDLDAAIALFRDRFACEVSAPVEAPAQQVRIAYVELGNARIELLSPMTADSPVAKFLARRPQGGLHHLALGVADADAAAAQARGESFHILGAGAPAPGHHGRPLFFLDPAALLGTLTEVEQAARPDDLPSH
jgi:methylmalonyl-CoA/ethylmalonyl-CoA epimerase